MQVRKEFLPDTIDSPDDGHEVARNMWRIEINISEKRIVRQVGHLPEC
jgi:hypothetical protein